MKKDSGKAARSSRATYDVLEEMARLKIQEFIQDVFNEEIAEFLRRGKSERIKGIDIPKNYRNGKGKPRKLALMNGTITIRRPRLRDVNGFESKVLPLFKRRSRELGEMLPELYLHGLANRDFELALRGLLGEGAPLSAASIQRLKGKWQAEYQQWKEQDLSGLEVTYQWAEGPAWRKTRQRSW